MDINTPFLYFFSLHNIVKLPKFKIEKWLKEYSSKIKNDYLPV